MRSLLAATVAWMMLAGPASAATMLATFYGTVYSGYLSDIDCCNYVDSNGTGFGLTGNIDGQAIVARLVYDTEVGLGNESHREGYFDIYANPFKSISVTINGITQPLALGYWSNVGVTLGKSFGVFPEDSFTKLRLHINTPAAPARLDQPFAVDGTGDGYFLIYGQGYGGVSVSRIEVSAVPEPSTWAMLLIGFSLIGTAIRLRRNWSLSPA